MNKYRKEYCEENGLVKINPENTKLYDYIEHLENKLEQALLFPPHCVEDGLEMKVVENVQNFDELWK